MINYYISYPELHSANPRTVDFDTNDSQLIYLLYKRMEIFISKNINGRFINNPCSLKFSPFSSSITITFFHYNSYESFTKCYKSYKNISDSLRDCLVIYFFSYHFRGYSQESRGATERPSEGESRLLVQDAARNERNAE